LELSRAASKEEEEEKFFAAAVLLATRPEIVEGRVRAAGEGLISRSKRVVGWLGGWGVGGAKTGEKKRKEVRVEKKKKGRARLTPPTTPLALAIPKHFSFSSPLDLSNSESLAFRERTLTLAATPEAKQSAERARERARRDGMSMLSFFLFFSFFEKNEKSEGEERRR